MGKFSRDKGQRAERQVCALLQPIVDLAYARAGVEAPMLKRNLEQTQVGGFDIVGLSWLALEIKHCETLQVAQWWSQTLHQAGYRSGGLTAGVVREPVLFYKRNNVAWSVRMYGSIGCDGMRKVRTPVVISVEAFGAYLRKRIEMELAKAVE